MAPFSFFKKIFQRKEDHEEADSLIRTIPYIKTRPYIGYFIFRASFTVLGDSEDKEQLEQSVLEALSEALSPGLIEKLLEIEIKSVLVCWHKISTEPGRMEAREILREMLNNSQIDSIGLPAEKCFDIPFDNRVLSVFFLTKREIEKIHEQLKLTNTEQYIGALLFNTDGKVRLMPFFGMPPGLPRVKDVPKKKSITPP